jgi:4-hydroxy-3-polyprenylbenzoate decarboxylase
MDNRDRLIVAISGASGAILGIRLLLALQHLEIETHLIVSAAARATIAHETNWTIAQVLALAYRVYDPADIAAPIASGSFPARGMVVIPCSIKSLSAIANSYSADLPARAADVTLKEGRPLALVVREAPLHAGHLELMLKAARLGAIIFPPVPMFYATPGSIEEMADQIAGRVLERIGVPNDLAAHWEG